MQNVPAEGFQPFGGIFREREAGRAFNRDAVAIVDPAEVVQLQVPGQTTGFVTDPFHHAAVAAEGIDAVCENVETGSVEVIRQPFLSDGHAD